jgi:hypothetical protein
MERKVVRSMCKLENIKTEVIRLNIDILGSSEIKMERRRRLVERQLQIYLLRRQKQHYSSWNNIKQGLGTKGKKYLLYNDRIMLIKLKADENDLVIIQTYFWKQS